MRKPVDATDDAAQRGRMRLMQDADLDDVVAIEQNSFASPWLRRHFEHELHRNPCAVNWVVERQGRVVAYACLWCIEDETKINNLAVRGEYRGAGLGGWFLDQLLADACRRGCRSATLEVRPSNRPALALYRGRGFNEIGRRAKYYAVEGEDAIVMFRRLD